MDTDNFLIISGGSPHIVWVSQKKWSVEEWKGEEVEGGVLEGKMENWQCHKMKVLQILINVECFDEIDKQPVVHWNVATQ